MVPTTVDIDTTQATLNYGDVLAAWGLWGGVTIGVVWLVTLLIAIVIAKKAGFSGWWGAFVVLIPLLGWLVAVILALLRWPALKERDEAIKILESNNLVLPSRAKKVAKATERQAAIDAEARRNIEAAKAKTAQAEAQAAAPSTPTAPAAPPAAVEAVKPAPLKPEGEA